MQKKVYLIPILVFAVMVGFFIWGLNPNRDPRAVPSVLINTPLPTFALDPLPSRDHGLSNADFNGKVALINVFGSWCVACAEEHPYLATLKSKGVVIYGVDWRERNPADGLQWLERHGDPYTQIGLDPESRLAIDLGVTGAPETFIVDKKGVIRFKQVGPINEEVWTTTLAPIIARLEAGS